MSEDWYPKTVNVGPEGTPGTYQFMENAYQKEESFTYAELGIYNADTVQNVCERFPNCEIFLFDFEEPIARAKAKLAGYPNRIHYFENSQKYNDSYNWNLLKLITTNSGRPIFDYVFLDGAHTFAVDGLSYFLCDRLLRVGGYLDFDDYRWRLRGSTLDPQNIPAIGEQYTDEQIDSFQVKLIVDELVKRTDYYTEVLENKIFQKTGS